MLRCLVANRDVVPLALPQAIARFVKQPQRLLAIEREFSPGDPVLACAALFGLLQSGRIGAGDTSSCRWICRGRSGRRGWSR